MTPGTGLGGTHGGKKEIRPIRSGQEEQMPEGKLIPLQAPESYGKTHLLLYPAQMDETE